MFLQFLVSVVVSKVLLSFRLSYETAGESEAYKKDVTKEFLCRYSHKMLPPGTRNVSTDRLKYSSLQ